MHKYYLLFYDILFVHKMNNIIWLMNRKGRYKYIQNNLKLANILIDIKYKKNGAILTNKR